MQKIMFNERYGLQSAVFEGRKTQTRRELFYSAESVCFGFNKQGKLECFTYDDEKEYPIHTSRYAKGEIVAVAQRYSEIADEMKDAICAEELGKFYVKPFIDTKGWNSKMFVRADLMLQHIKILDIRCERLQDICNEDCISEGISISSAGVYLSRYVYVAEFYDVIKRACYTYSTPKEAFCGLIGKLNGKKLWDTNPYVIVYEFELVD